MRRLILVLAAFALLVPATAEAESAKPYPRVVVKSGSAHIAGKKLVGAVVVTNTGRRRSGREFVELGIGVPPGESGASSALVQRLVVKPLEVGEKQRIHFSHLLPVEASPGSWTVTACLDGGTCRRIGQVTIAGTVPSPAPPPAPSQPGPAPTPSTPSPAPLNEDIVPPEYDPPSTFPQDPIGYTAGRPFGHSTAAGVGYFGFVPRSYDASNQTPTPLLVWLHGCYGEAEGDAWVVDPEEEIEPTQDWLTLSLAGREGGAEGSCWVPSVDEAKVMAALADFETHFNVDRREVILAGYSSGGDLAYRTGFRHSSSFSGLLIENSSPFRDTESSAAESLAAATTKPRIIHLAHTGDTTYRIAGVRQEVGEVAAAGFPIELIERPGTHSDANTDSDLRKYLLSRIDELLAGLDLLT